ncbi:isochorismatase family protein [Saliphagus sp. GCM10025334]
MTANIEDAYQRAGFTEDIGFGDRPAVVVVDLQTAFTDPSCPLGSNLDTEVAETETLVRAARRARLPVFFTITKYRDDLRDGGPFAEKISSADALCEGSGWTDIDPRLSVMDEDMVIDKRQPSAFFETKLDSVLTHEGVDTVVVAGATTSGCVRATVVDACSNGYRTIVAKDCVGDRATEPHEANLFDMDAKYADVLSLDAVTDALR